MKSESSANRSSENRVRSFDPAAGRDPRILILGSMPGAESLLRQEYYAHPRNAFWPIMGSLVGAGTALPYSERLEKMTTAGLALWDVLASCRREGSLDGGILRDSEEPNPVGRFLEARPSIAVVAFNGRKAEEAFRRHILPELSGETIGRLTLVVLPSTSPAHAGRNFSEKLEAWRAVVTDSRAAFYKPMNCLLKKSN